MLYAATVPADVLLLRAMYKVELFGLTASALSLNGEVGAGKVRGFVNAPDVAAVLKVYTRSPPVQSATNT